MLGYTEEEMRDKCLKHIEFSIQYLGTVISEYAVDYNYALARGQAMQSSILGLITIEEENSYVNRLSDLRKEKLDSLKATK